MDARNVDGSTPLCDACSAGSLECVRLLLQYGAKANPALTSRTASPLHEACMGGESVACCAFVCVFGKVNFIYVCISGNSECVKLLISMGACLEAYDLYHGTPLHAACANEHTDCVRELLNAGEGLHSRMNQTQSTTQYKLPYSQRANCRPAGIRSR